MDQHALTRLFRAEHGRIIAAMLCYTQDLDLIEDALQDACLQAIEQWPDKGQPNNLGAWLLTVTKRRMIDRMRRHHYQKSHPDSDVIIGKIEAKEEPLADDYEIEDEQLKLIFTCCHPALPRDSRIALTLKTLCGLSAREIARAFLTSEPTMLQRLTRAKQKIQRAAIPYHVPQGEQLSQRLPSVLEVIYLIYNESHTAMEGQTLSREELANEALRLTDLLQHTLSTPEVTGLKALMLFNEARRSARVTSTGDYIPLALQDRSAWHRHTIEEAHALLTAALRQSAVGPYQLQAAISGLHCKAPSWQQTDWLQIYALYQMLATLQPSPVVALNQCVALAYSGSPDKAYGQLNALAPSLQRYQPFFAAKAEIASLLNRHDAAIDAYQCAIALTQNQVEQAYLAGKLEALKTHGEAG
ncbi:RNA polymerase sigma factor [Alteromonas gilva]|uniref:Sigma-70 family RNA polymerase sigma factor n=1 Tax=Alteromonas gilva TaxID=2987522 RepID=A0ABT5L203_9ALTE|nr:sigma-70 family RNA polymerase sigma factor [Alteromonas gilva]MDC8831078.1 sigma-70 family RNA polymerase sigma factor [Alteromonas gilva]